MKLQLKNPAKRPPRNPLFLLQCSVTFKHRQRRDGITMREKIVTWVVYTMTIHKKTIGTKAAVCEQSEWDAMELARPGYHHLVRAGIASEVEAESLARGPQPSGSSASRTKAC